MTTIQNISLVVSYVLNLISGLCNEGPAIIGKAKVIAKIQKYQRILTLGSLDLELLYSDLNLPKI